MIKSGFRRRLGDSCLPPPGPPPHLPITGSATAAPPHHRIRHCREGGGWPLSDPRGRQTPPPLRASSALHHCLSPPPPLEGRGEGRRRGSHGTPPPSSCTAWALHCRWEGGEGRRGGSCRCRPCPSSPPPPPLAEPTAGREEGGEGQRSLRGGGERESRERKGEWVVDWLEIERDEWRIKRRVGMGGSIFVCGWIKSPEYENTLIFACGCFKWSVWKNWFFAYGSLRSRMGKRRSSFAYVDTYGPSVIYWMLVQKNYFLVMLVAEQMTIVTAPPNSKRHRELLIEMVQTEELNIWLVNVSSQFNEYRADNRFSHI